MARLGLLGIFYNVCQCVSPNEYDFIQYSQFLRYLGVEIDSEHYATVRERLLRETVQGLLIPNATAVRLVRTSRQVRRC